MEEQRKETDAKERAWTRSARSRGAALRASPRRRALRRGADHRHARRVAAHAHLGHAMHDERGVRVRRVAGGVAVDDEVALVRAELGAALVRADVDDDVGVEEVRGAPDRARAARARARLLRLGGGGGGLDGRRALRRRAAADVAAAAAERAAELGARACAWVGGDAPSRRRGARHELGVSSPPRDVTAAARRAKTRRARRVLERVDHVPVHVPIFLLLRFAFCVFCVLRVFCVLVLCSCSCFAVCVFGFRRRGRAVRASPR